MKRRDASQGAAAAGEMRHPGTSILLYLYINTHASCMYDMTRVCFVLRCMRQLCLGNTGDREGAAAEKGGGGGGGRCAVLGQRAALESRSAVLEQRAALESWTAALRSEGSSVRSGLRRRTQAISHIKTGRGSYVLSKQAGATAGGTGVTSSEDGEGVPAV